MSSLKLLNQKNGLILCDDALLNVDHTSSAMMYASLATFQTLNELKKQDLIDFKSAFKRLHPEYYF